MVQATYDGVRTQVATAYVNVSVTRNENSPRFEEGQYKKDILEYFPLGESILQIRATDRDQNVSPADLFACQKNVSELNEPSCSSLI